MPQIATLISLGLLLLSTVGCNQSTAIDAQTLAAHRSRLVLAEEPDGVQTVADVRTTLLGAGHDHDGDGLQDHAPGDHADDSHEAHDTHAEQGEDHKVDNDHAEHAGDEAHTDAAHDEHAHDDEGHDDDAHDDDAHDHAARTASTQAHATESIDVVMIGHVGGLANPWAEAQPDYPFSKSQAILFVADPQAIVENEASGHSHAPGEECAFCAAHAADKADMLAMVQFVDEKGDVLRMDARQLFDVKEQDTVVVRGQARVTAGGILVVDAEGLYIRK